MVEGDRFRQLVEHLPEVVWLLDADLSEILYTNPAFEALLEQLSPQTEWPLDAPDLVHPEDTATAQDWLETIQHDIRTGDWDETYPFEARLIDRNGNEQWLETIGVPVVEDGVVIGFVGISSDITEYVYRERELETQISKLDQFVSMVSHDIRTPLTIAQANLELYEEKTDTERLDKIGEALDRIEELTTDLVTLARGRSNEAELTSVDVAEIADRAWDAIDTREATLETEPGNIEADSSMLQTLLENLFRNAVGHGGSDVTVRVYPVDDGFIVEDTGSGIPIDLRKDVQEHGFSTGYGGSGFGLTIISRIAEAHDWQFDINESREGGARLEFHKRKHDQ